MANDRSDKYKKGNSRSSAPSRGGDSRGGSKSSGKSGKSGKSDPTHSMYILDDGERSYPKGVFVYENESEWGTYLSVVVHEPIEKGTYFVTKRKPVDGKASAGKGRSKKADYDDEEEQDDYED